ncbi:hypothetical protein K2X33_05370 [bacterium]|nr:hypothetical protein [bacterium]
MEQFAMPLEKKTRFPLSIYGIPPHLFANEAPIFRSVFIAFALLLAGFGSAEIRADDEQALVQRVLTPIRVAWQRASVILRDRDRFPEEKKRALDDFFNELRATCDGHCDRIGELIQGAQSEFGDGSDMVQKEIKGAGDLWDRYGKALDPNWIRGRLPAIFHLIRKVVALEEENLFRVMSEGDPLTTKIGGAAGIADSASFVYRQGRALIRLAFVLKSIGEKAAASMDEADGKIITGLQRGLSSVNAGLDEHLPEIVKAVEDLGIYYVKLAQTLGTLLYAVNPAAYEKFERFQNDNTTRMSEPEVVATIERDLGGPWQMFYEELELRPFANASTAQIHNAKIRIGPGKTRDVVVKLLKGYVSKELDWNQSVNNLFFEWARMEWLGGEDSLLFDLFADVVASLGETFRGEFAYEDEARRQEFMRRTLGFRTGIKIPKVYTHLCGAGVITMEKIEGIHKFGQNLRDAFAPVKDPNRKGEEGVFRMNFAGQNFSIYDSDKEEKEPQESESESQPEAEVAAAEAALGENADTVVQFRDFYKRAHKELGFKFGAQYLQFFLRGLGPPMSIFLARTKAKAAIDRAGGEEALTEQQSAEWKGMTERFHGLQVAMLDMTLHLKELHSDLQPANAQELPGASQVVLLDWGQTVQTEGLVFNPVRLVWNLTRGDEVGVAKTLAKMGKLRDGKTHQDLAPLVREFMDKAGFKKRSRWSAIRSLRGHEEKDAEEEKEEETDEAEEEKPAESKPAFKPAHRPPFTPRTSKEIAPDDAEARPLKMHNDSETKKDKKKLKSPNQKVADAVRWATNSILDYPFRHVEYMALRANARAAQWYDQLIGKRLARRRTVQLYRESLKADCPRSIADAGEETPDA